MRISRAAFVIAERELRAFLDRPAGYVLLVVFSALVDFLFFRQAFSSGEASMRPLFQMLPWVLLVFVPAVSMRLIAEEARAGTLETLLTEPVSEVDIIAGKLLGGWATVGLALLTTVPVAIGLSTAGSLDWGIVFSQYLAGLLLALALTSIGLFASTTTRNQVTASIVAAISGFGLMAVGWDIVTLALPRRVADVLTSISLLSHTDQIARGVIDVRDLLYFLSVTFLFAFGAYLLLLWRRANRTTERFTNLQVGGLVLAGIVLAANVLIAPYGFKLDLTSARLFTLSPATTKVVSELPENVTITLFASRELPPQIAGTYRDVRDVLREYAADSGGRVTFAERFPDIDPEAKAAAGALGVEAIQFNVLQQEQYSVSQGWLGVVMQAGTKREAIPFVKSTNDLEYQLTSLMLKLKGGSKRSIAFLGGHSDPAADQTTILRGELAKTYTVTDVTADPKKGLDLKGVRVLMVVAPQTDLSPAEKTALDTYLKSGGAAFFMLDGYTINTQFLVAMANQAGVLPDVLPRYGVSVQNKLIYDVRSNELLQFQSGGQAYAIPYPYWARMAVAAPEVVGALDTALLPWPSPVVEATGAPAGTQFVPLLKTSQYAGVQEGEPSISPDQQLAAPDNPQTYVAGAAVLGPGTTNRYRLVVIGSGSFAGDRFAQQAPENFALALNAVDWLAQDESLASIRAKRAEPRQLRFDSAGQQLFVVWGNTLGVPLAIAAFGAWRLVRRRRKSRSGEAA